MHARTHARMHARTRARAHTHTQIDLVLMERGVKERGNGYRAPAARELTPESSPAQMRAPKAQTPRSHHLAGLRFSKPQNLKTLNLKP